MTRFGNATTRDHKWIVTNYVELDKGVITYINHDGTRSSPHPDHVDKVVRAVSAGDWLVLETDGADGFDMSGVKVVHVCKRGSL